MARQSNSNRRGRDRIRISGESGLRPRMANMSRLQGRKTGENGFESGVCLIQVDAEVHVEAPGQGWNRRSGGGRGSTAQHDYEREPGRRRRRCRRGRVHRFRWLCRTFALADGGDTAAIVRGRIASVVRIPRPFGGMHLHVAAVVTCALRLRATGARALAGCEQCAGHQRQVQACEHHQHRPSRGWMATSEGGGGAAHDSACSP